MKHANVALFIPHNGCPHQCSFCSQHSITGQQYQPTAQDVKEAAERAKCTLRGNASDAELAFFGGSFTAIDRGYMLSLLEAAFPYVEDGTFSGIRISTRPDAIDPETLTLLRQYGVTAVELGAQSMDDVVLKKNRRGHTAQDVASASGMIHQFGFSLGLQMMTGLYGDSISGAKATARMLAELEPDTVRIYPTIIMRGTELGQRYLNGEYQKLSLEETVALCSELLLFFEERGIAVIRLGLHDTPELKRDMLAGPWHPAFRELCESRLYLNQFQKYLTDHPSQKREITIFVAPQGLSKAVGQKKQNLALLAQMGYNSKIKADPLLTGRAFRIT